jgi:hypothetical protein
MLVIALGIAGGCVADEIADNADFVMVELSNTSAPTGAIKLEGETLVYATDLPDLVSRVRSAQLDSNRTDLVKDYLTLQERVDCILDDAEEAADNDTSIRCQGKILVEENGEHGLLGVSEILDEIEAREGQLAQREYLATYLRRWEEVQRINRVEESLGQLKRTNSIPLFGTLVNTIHRFPILFEGDELVPRGDIPDLLDRYRALDTDAARRTMVTEYLER